MKAGKSVDDAVKSMNFAKYPGFESTRLQAAVQAIYEELGKKLTISAQALTGQPWCLRDVVLDVGTAVHGSSGHGCFG
jgi:hypothetical protein